VETKTAGRFGSAPSSASSFAPFVGLLRPANGAIASGAVLVGAFVARRPTEWGPAALGAACAFLAASAANALNDVRDRQADAVNRPERPIPAGSVGSGHATRLSLALYAGAVCLALPIGAWAVALVAAWVALTALYSVSLKAVPLVGNVVVAAVAASPFVLGGLSQAGAAAALVPTGLAFLVHLAREAVKDAEDVEGDSRAGFRTLAVARGPGAALAVARAGTVLLMAAAPVPYFAGRYGIGYALAVAVIETLLGRVLYVLAKSPDRPGLRVASTGLKWVMLVGLTAFVLGVIF
jgi:geranylgeranylglycerol-phosphate geranylgeranyltransferase